MDRNDGETVPGRFDLGHATVRELIVQLARVEEEGMRCTETGGPEARELAERGQAIVRELRSRGSEALPDALHSPGEGAER